MERLKLGMVGGGRGAFIGGVHRMAARLDGHWDIVAGALSSDAARAAASAADLGIAPDRSYASYDDMARAEAARTDGIDAVAIVTPNHMHAGPAIAFLKAGINVICDKPLAATMEQAAQIDAAAKASSALFILTHNYSGYPLIRQARDMIARGDLGTLRFVQVEYLQDWLAGEAAEDNKQAAWRTDPTKAGGGAIGDIGTHAYHLANFVTGLTATRLAADLSSFVPGRQVDDNAQVLLRYEGGAKGMLTASQVAIGHENTVRLRVYGDKGGLDWSQDRANEMRFTRIGEAPRILTRGGPDAPDPTRVPAGHPEGYLGAFATLYTEAATLIRARATGQSSPSLLPTVADGLAGVQFIAACQESAKADCGWVTL